MIALVAGTCSALTVTAADTSDLGVVYVHFYNGDGNYRYDNWEGKNNVEWGAYYWIENGKSARELKDDEEFSNEIEVDGVKKNNVGKIYKIQLNANETSAVKKGKKLGLIMVRSYVDELGYFTPYWNNNKGKDISSDREIKVELDENNEYHVWIIAGDKNNYTSLESAKKAFERIESARFDDFDTLILKATKPISTSFNVKIYAVTDAINDPEGKLVMKDLRVEDEGGGVGTKIKGVSNYFSYNFNWNADYQVEIADISQFRTSIVKTRLYLSDEFKAECLPADDVKLGAEYTRDRTTFRVWAPLSTNVVVNFYRTGNETDPDLYSSAKEMTLTEKGVWEYVAVGDYNGVYYTYTNYVGGDENEIVDVYANAVGVNGNRAMVCDLDATDPDGWETDTAAARSIRENNSESAVIWEIHVRDFSISPDSGMTYKGKYLAFTEENTHVKGSDTLNSGIAYLKELGINYVHLNPVYDFSTVDEEFINNTDYTTKQNWGYDPKNYNVPEGSYATNAENGEVRIKEFKQMVASLHKAGIGVIMDVVYNHTYTADGNFDKTVPGYYYRQALTGETGSFGYQSWSTNALGIYNLSDGSGCSNETASEREMYRKYMIDSLTYWASEYHIDGFRFDLMAIHDVTTMNAIRSALNGLDGGTGILLYGEPWAAGALGIDPKTGAVSADYRQLNAMPGIAAFNDRMREGIKGNNDGGTGYVQGNVDGNLNKVMAGINGLFLNYGGDGVVSDDYHHTVTYTTSHDNYTLWDQLVNTTVKDKSPTIFSERNSVLEKKNIMAATLTLTSKGIGFILAGEEAARTKFGNHNSYNAQDKVNAIDYNRQEQFANLFNWYKGLIRLRTKDFKTIAQGYARAEVYTTNGGCIVYIYNKEVATDVYNKVMVMLNPYGGANTFSVEGDWTVIANGTGFNADGLGVASGTITLPAYGTAILVQ